MCKQGRDDDIEVKVNIQKPYPYIFLHYSCALVWKRRRKGALYVKLHFHIICSYFVCILLGMQSLRTSFNVFLLYEGGAHAL